MIRRFLYFDKIILYSNNAHQPKYERLREIMDEISKHVGYQVFETRGHDQIMDTTEYPKNNRKLVIFDDMINYSKQQDKIANHFSDGRHQGISTCYLSQSYHDLDPKIRNNCSHMILFQPHSKTHLNLIAKENFIDPHMFDQLKPYEFLYVDKNNKTIKKNFDKEIM